MKIRCDMCNKAEASVFCSGDEAALCDECDRHVHHANKLATKHNRFSLLHPSFKEIPLCDICREGRAFLFCQEDRAILCGDCDIQIHKANEQTQKHSRFVLTGVKFSSPSSLYLTTINSTTTTTSSSNGGSEPAAIINDGKTTRSLSTASNKRPKTTGDCCNSNSNTNTNTNSGLMMFNSSPSQILASNYNEESQVSNSGSYSTSSISEYLETLPGWCVEDFLDPSYSSATNYGHSL